MLDDLRELNAGAEPLGSFGAVIGATIGDDVHTEEDFGFNGPILAPGFGAQGGTVADLRRIFGAAVAAVTPSSSRELLRKGPSVAALRDEALRLNDGAGGVARMRRAGAVLLLLALVTAGCADQQEKYCDAVKDHQQELGQVLGDAGPNALLEALPIFRDLADEAPEDVRDEWRIVIDALDGLEQALDDAGVDPGDVRPRPPARRPHPGATGPDRRRRRHADQPADGAGLRRRAAAGAGRVRYAAQRLRRSAAVVHMGEAARVDCRARRNVAILSSTLPPTCDE